MPDSKYDERYRRSSVVVVAAHPDDEVIGMSVQLARVGAHCTLLHITDGSPRDLSFAQQAGCATREQYAAARREELIAAVNLAGVHPEQCMSLDYTDQEAAVDMAGLTFRLRDVLKQLQPKFLFTHAYEGGHPDHDATAFAVAHALPLLAADGLLPPLPMEFAGYHHNAQEQFEAFTFLEHTGESGAVTELNEAERVRKQAMFDCYRTQQHVLANFPIGIERFRAAPTYDWTQPPHPGTLHYETYRSGMTGERFLTLARGALAALEAA